MVYPRGLEPPTPALKVLCSSYWTTGTYETLAGVPYLHFHKGVEAHSLLQGFGYLLTQITKNTAKFGDNSTIFSAVAWLQKSNSIFIIKSVSYHNNSPCNLFFLVVGEERVELSWRRYQHRIITVILLSHIRCSGFALPGTLRNVVERYEALSVQSSWQNPHAPRVLRGIFYLMYILYHTF